MSVPPFLSQLSQGILSRFAQQRSTEWCPSPKYCRTVFLLHDLVTKNLYSYNRINMNLNGKNISFVFVPPKVTKLAFSLFLATLILSSHVKLQDLEVSVIEHSCCRETSSTVTVVILAGTACEQ